MKTQNQAAYTLADLKAAAYGRWPEIHAALGIDPRYLKPRHHCPCPRCGGKDRYRYTDYQGRGGFICNQCYPEGGSGFDLLMLVFGYDFAEAARQVAAVLGLAGGQVRQYQPTRAAPVTAANPEPDCLPALLGLWEEALPLADGDPVTGYLKTRGLPLPETLPAALRYEPDLPYWTWLSDGMDCLLRLAAMLAAITTPDGQLRGLHQTYLQPDGAGGWRKLAVTHPETGETLPVKKMRARFSGSLKGAAVHLAAPDEQGRLIVAEGIESALAASALFGLPAAAALSAHGMAVFEWPPETRELFIAADNDGNGTGIQAAEKLARRALLAGIKANIWQPEQTDTDALDELNRRQTKGETS